jgi:tetratricopeptide (TPR) repeat protein
MSLASEPSGSVDQALAYASRLLATDPLLADEQAREILKVVPGHPVALLLRGLALGRAGRGDEAVHALREAVRRQPDLPRAWLALGDHLSAVGDAAGADAAYGWHIKYSNRDPALLAAASALAESRIPEAELLLRQHLKMAPTDVAAIRMLAEVAARLGRDDDAVRLLARCLELAPSFHAARHNYALVLNRAERTAEALEQVEILLALDPDNPGYRNQKAVILCRLGDYEPAIAIYGGLLAQYPNHGKIWLSQGHALKTAGRQEQAVQAYRRSIELEPAFGEAWWSLANLKTVRFDDQDVARMRAQLARADLDAGHRLHFEFALGKALEDRGLYEESFAHYEAGNEQRRSQLLYSAEENTGRMRRSKRVFDADFFASRAGAGADSREPIFVVGLPRSGSTLIEQILSSHSAVEGTMELPEVIAMTRLLRQQTAAPQSTSYHEVLATCSHDELRAMGERYLERTRVQRKTGAPRFIDKMPNNFAHIGLIHLMLPNARIIDARRHPLACCFSGFKQHFARGQNFTYGLDDIGRYYRDYVELMAHFDQVLPGRVHRVHYESMVEDTEAEVRRLLDYCGLDFEPQCLRFFENDRPVRTASSEQVRQPIYREGIDHWRHFEPWLGPLKAALGPVLDSYPAAPTY